MSSKSRIVSLSLLPLAASSSYLAFQFPAVTDTLYSRGLYPLVARGFSMFGRLSFSLAEPLFVALVLLLVYGIYRWSRGKRDRLRRAVVAIWVALAHLSNSAAIFGFRSIRKSSVSVMIVSFRMVPGVKLTQSFQGASVLRHQP